MFIAHCSLAAFCNIAAIVLLAGLGTAHAQGVTISQNAASVSADCAGGDAVIRGNGNSVSLRSACRSLTVNGAGNSATIDLQAGGPITFNGAGNTVAYRPVGGTQDPSVTDNGRGNLVAERAGADEGTITGNASDAGGVSVHGSNGDTVQIGPGGMLRQ